MNHPQKCMTTKNIPVSSKIKKRKKEKKKEERKERKWKEKQGRSNGDRDGEIKDVEGLGLAALKLLKLNFIHDYLHVSKTKCKVITALEIRDAYSYNTL